MVLELTGNTSQSRNQRSKGSNPPRQGQGMASPKTCVGNSLLLVGKVSADINTLRSTLMNALRDRGSSTSGNPIIHIAQIPFKHDIDGVSSQVIDNDLDLVEGKSDDGDLGVLEGNRNSLVDSRPVDVSPGSQGGGIGSRCQIDARMVIVGPSDEGVVLLQDSKSKVTADLLWLHNIATMYLACKVY
jgi:hypothetical protein